MNILKKVAIGITSVGGMLIAFASKAATETVDTIGTSLAPVLGSTVQALIATFISFVTSNLPLIVVFGFTVGMVFWLINKAKNGARGG
jgi:hypothetical protein